MFIAVGDAQTMEEILAENDLPVQVRYASYNIELKSTLEFIKGVNILIMKTYVEYYMQGNCMEDGKKIHMNNICFIAYV